MVRASDIRVGDILVGTRPRSHYIHDKGYVWEVLEVNTIRNTCIKAVCINAPGDSIYLNTQHYIDFEETDEWFKIELLKPNTTPLSKLINKIYVREIKKLNIV